MKTKRCFVIGPMNTAHIKHLDWLAKDVIQTVLAGRDFEVRRQNRVSKFVLDGLEDVIGSAEGPEDLGSKKRHLDGYGR